MVAVHAMGLVGRLFRSEVPSWMPAVHVVRAFRLKLVLRNELVHVMVLRFRQLVCRLVVLGVRDQVRKAAMIPDVADRGGWLHMMKAHRGMRGVADHGWRMMRMGLV